MIRHRQITCHSVVFEVYFDIEGSIHEIHLGDQDVFEVISDLTKDTLRCIVRTNAARWFAEDEIAEIRKAA